MDLPRRLDTERLTLLRPDPARADAIQRAIVDSWPELCRFLHWTRDGLPDALEIAHRQEREAGLWDRGDAFHADLFTRHDGAFVGKVSLFDLDRGVPKASVGYWLARAATGRGYMTEAVDALADAGFAHLHLIRLQLDCSSANVRSAALARRCGFTLEGRLRRTGRDTLDGALVDTLIFARYGADNREPDDRADGPETQTP